MERFFAGIMLDTVLIAAKAWVLMVALGVVAAHTGHDVAFGYGLSIVIAWAVSTVTAQATLD